MTSWLSMLLLTEGRTDDRILPRLLERSADEVCARVVEVSVDVGEVIVVRPRPGPPNIDEIVAEAIDNDGAFNVLLVHRDIGSSRERSEREWIDPIRDAWSKAGRSEELVIAAPVRETEAWALADGDALRRVFGVNWTDERMGLPRSPRSVEQEEDPKKVLENIRGQISRRSTDYYARLGDLIRLERLRRVPSFQAWETELEEALRKTFGGHEYA